MQQFGRSYQLIIGNDKESIVIEQTNATGQGLTMSFDIVKSITSDPNTATFSITNLSQSTRNLITDKKYNRLMFNAGYQDDLRALFVGYIDDVENKKESTDIITIMTCSDGSKDYRDARVAVTVAKGATDQEIVKQVTSAMPDTQNGEMQFTTERKLPRGKTLVGNARDVLKDVAKNHDADWSIQDGQLLFLPRQNALANNEGFLISESTGLIGSPQKTSDGVEYRCLLNNVMRIGQLFRGESIIKELSGDFKISKLQMKGSNIGSDWMCIVEGQNGQFYTKEKKA